MTREELRTLGLETIKELETETGILASGKEEIYGCVFGRDSLITCLKLLKTSEREENPYLLSLAKKILLNLAKLQGKELNIESGEEPGKIIHEYRTSNHEHLTSRKEAPWYVYPDGSMKNYDSVDSTPLFVIAVSKFLRLSKDESFAALIRPSVEMALEWVINNINADPHGFLSYKFNPERKYGGLTTQSWMDSYDSIFHEDGSPTPYPIAPAEAQAYAYLAFKLSGLEPEALKLKQRFNQSFVSNNETLNIAFALDGHGKPMRSLRSSIGHILWASTERDSILESSHIPKLVELMLSPELFEPGAGIRTLSKTSSRFSPNSYHNGSIWPHDTAMIAEGLDNFGYSAEASRVREALLNSWTHFKTPIELFVHGENGFEEYTSPHGQKACTKQAWSAASMLAEL